MLAKRQWDEAGAHCRRVLELAPNHPAALNSLGLVFQGLGRLDQAAACFDAALQAKPDLVEALNNHAVLHLDAGNAGEALALLIRALGVRENDESQRLLAACLTSGKPLPATDAVPTMCAGVTTFNALRNRGPGWATSSPSSASAG
jgi:Flp pilus assembly protein TadD